MRSMIACFALAATLVSTSAFAKDAAAGKDGVVREINKGLYMKSGIGATPYFASNSLGGSLLSPVMTVDLSIGNDIVDKERLSMAVEAQLSQQLHDGPKDEGIAFEAPIVQGDVHIFAITATYEVSAYITRRFGVGVRGGGGVSVIPLLMKDPYYNDQIVTPYWGGVRASAHEGVQPTVRAGATIEYYTKLSHFSVGADIDALIVVGSLGFGVSPTGYLKYTF